MRGSCDKTKLARLATLAHIQMYIHIHMQVASYRLLVFLCLMNSCMSLEVPMGSLFSCRFPKKEFTNVSSDIPDYHYQHYYYYYYYYFYPLPHPTLTPSHPHY